MSWWELEEEAYQNAQYLEILQRLHGSDAMSPEQKSQLMKDMKSNEKAMSRRALTVFFAIPFIVAVIILVAILFSLAL